MIHHEIVWENTRTKKPVLPGLDSFVLHSLIPNPSQGNTIKKLLRITLAPKKRLCLRLKECDS